MKTYTLDDIKHYKDYHKELWEFVVEKLIEGDKRQIGLIKTEWFEKHWNGEKPDTLCFACEITKDCSDCILGREKDIKGCCDGLYDKLCKSHDIATAIIIKNRWKE